MLNKDEFIDFILSGPGQAAVAADAGESAMPEGFEGFGFHTEETPAAAEVAGSSFAKRLLEASGFGLAKQRSTASLIRSSDAVARHLPTRASFWDMSGVDRPFRTLLFEAEIDHSDLLKIPAFKSRKMAHLNDVEGALSRFVAEALEGFQRGGEGVTADVVKGRKTETLCVISILDKREWKESDGTTPPRLVCFGTYNDHQNGGLETFRITERTRSWEPHLAREHLGLLYKRQFRKLSGKHWQEAFTTPKERKQAERLLEVCSQDNIAEETIQESVLGLLDTIALGFGLSKKRATDKLRLRADQLPPDHDIGMEPETRENEEGGNNPFRGVTLRDEKSRLLGYIVYPLKNTSDADRLRTYLKEHNRFHNVLVVYPDHEETHIELWQGTDQLQGKLRRGQGYKDAAEVVNLLSRFFVVSKAKVNNPPELAKELAYRARYLRSIALEQLEQESDSGELRALHAAFKEALVHDQTEEDFADAFAQTLTYSLLTARWVLSAQGGKSGDRFTRKAAMKKLAIGSRFLSEMFTAVLSMQLDKQNRLHWLVDDLTGLLDRVDVVSVFQDDGSDLTADPIIHFYEPFLQEYDAAIRMQRGVFYTPKPVVSYIVRSVDELLRTEFGLEDGLADTATWGDMVQRTDGLEIPEGASADQGFVQILDPATGTGTFLVEVIDVIHATMVKKWTAQGHTEAKVLALWNKYVPEQLLPRLNGYELMMAPYAVAHLKIGLKLHDTGYAFGSEARTQVYLTNALEPAQDFSETFAFAVPALAHEAKAVNAVKKDRRFTVVVGNPPYQNLGNTNKGPWILELLNAYKEGLNETKLNLDDDFIKFMRWADHGTQTVGSGVVGFVTPHTYLGSITRRRMREVLLGVYDFISILDMHGNIRRQEVSPDGSPDENVFDIQQGVAVAILSRRSGKKGSTVLHEDLWGTRLEKFRALMTISALKSRRPLLPVAELYLLTPNESPFATDYHTWPSLNEIFGTRVSGVQTKRDKLTIQRTAAALDAVLEDFVNLDADEIRQKYKLKPDGRDWKVPLAQQDVRSGNLAITPVTYRPFDVRYTGYGGRSKGFLAYPRTQPMPSMLESDNVGLVFKRQARKDAYGYTYFFVVNSIISEGLFSVDPNGREYIAPLFVYNDTDAEPDLFHGGPGCRVNLNAGAVSQLLLHTGLRFGEDIHGRELLAYIYGVCHSSVYRIDCADLLRRDYPRIPIAKSLAVLQKMVEHGEALLKLHLGWSHYEGTGESYTSDEGDNYVAPGHPKYADGHIAINSYQSFSNVPQVVWEARIGGYQVSKKWLSDRRRTCLSETEVQAYAQLLRVLDATLAAVSGVDKAISDLGGWNECFCAGPAK